MTRAPCLGRDERTVDFVDSACRSEARGERAVPQPLRPDPEQMTQSPAVVLSSARINRERF
jgi:hypothetical protein